jgi:hypothetical protein
MQGDIIKSEGNDKTAQKQLNKAKEKLSKKIEEKEIKMLLDKQIEITNLEKQLENFQQQEFEAKIEIITLPNCV